MQTWRASIDRRYVTAIRKPLFRGSLADAEIAENDVQQFLNIDAAGDAAEGVERQAEAR